MFDLYISEDLALKISMSLATVLFLIVFGSVVFRSLMRFFRFWKTLPILGKVIIPVGFMIFYLHGSIKSNQVFSVRPVPFPTVADLDIERGFKLSNVITNSEYSYALASNSVRNVAWHLAGGHSGFRKYNLGWCFPFGSNMVDKLFVFQDGNIFQNPRDEMPLIKVYDGILSFKPGYSDFWIMVDETIDTETLATFKVTCPELHALQIGHIIDNFTLKPIHITLLFIQRLGQT